MRMFKKLRVRIRKDTSGATMVEYGFLAGLIAIAMLVGLTQFSNTLVNTLAYVAADLTASQTTP